MILAFEAHSVTSLNCTFLEEFRALSMTLYYWWIRYPKSSKKWVKCKLNKTFLPFLQKFWHIWWSFAAPSAIIGILYFEKYSYMAKIWKNEEKSFSICLISQFSPTVLPRPKTEVSGTRLITGVYLLGGKDWSTTTSILILR